MTLFKHPEPKASYVEVEVQSDDIKISDHDEGI